MTSESPSSLKRTKEKAPSIPLIGGPGTRLHPRAAKKSHSRRPISIPKAPIFIDMVSDMDSEEEEATLPLSMEKEADVESSLLPTIPKTLSVASGQEKGADQLPPDLESFKEGSSYSLPSKAKSDVRLYRKFFVYLR